ncbi:recombination repair protein 1 isoform 2-T2 [Cochliomyia hominivorax]
MPPKKASGKKAQTKTAASAAASVDADLSNNGVKDEPQELLTNGTSLKDVEDTKETTPTTQTKVLKRSSGRAKNVANELETKAPEMSKKPAAKGRGKKKSNENEVIENEVASEVAKENQEENEEEKEQVAETNDEETVVSKATKGKKKAETKTKASKKEIKSEESSTQEEQAQEEVAEAKVNEKKGKSRKKKVEEVGDEIKIKEEIEEEKAVEEKVTKKSSRSTKKEKVTAPADDEPPKKKGRTKKDKSQTAEEVEVEKEDVAEDVKEKKPAKRGRAAAKAVIDDASTANGESEDVLPKKRSRKAPSVEKEVVAEKPKRGRGKKTDKVLEQQPEESSSTQGKEEDITNGQVKQEINEETKESPKTNKKEETQTEAPAKAKGGRKRAAPSTNNKKSTKKSAADDKEEADDDDDDVDGLDDGVVNTEKLEDETDESKPSKTKKKKTDSSSPLNATATKYTKADFELPPPAEGQTVEEPRFNLKISSWNVAGLRSWLKKEGLKFLEYEQPDIFCMQETKCTTDQLPEEVARIPGYHPYWLCMPGGYAGVAIYSKIMPINVEYGIGHKEFDDCGRIITAEYEKFFLINVYVPNSGRKLVNLEPRMRWEKLFQEFVKNLDSRKPVIVCGDMNVSHQEIDLANPKTNTRNAGFTKEEREKMSELLALGYVDTFRHLYPERKGAYTFWTYMGNARSRNVGWRLDYFIVSERFIKRVVDNCIRSQCLGSDHCPITLFLKL